MRPTRSGTGKRWRYGTAAVAVLTLGVASACSSSPSSSGGSASGSGSPSSSSSAGSAVSSFPRTETLYTSGTMYGPPTTWNPFDLSNYATGTQGLIYEPLYLYDPLHNKYISWLAAGSESAGWQGTTYVIHVRSGVKWSDGTPMTAADVAYSINLARTNTSDPYNANVATVTNAAASGGTVTVTFKGTPDYTEFTDYLWKAPVVPQHIWSKVPASQIVTDANTNPVGTGPMTLAAHNQQEVAYKTDPNWWATSALGLSFKFKYLVDVVNSSNQQELSQLLANNLDWSNNFLPGINTLAGSLGGNGGYPINFYYNNKPYMLSGNTVWLEPNTSKAPMNDVNFRRALAYALNPQAIAQTVYGGIATASNPVGLLPTLVNAGWLDQGVVSQYAATYSPSKAVTALAKSGYHGQPITIMAPAGWSDWNQAQTVIVSELKAVGINAQIVQPQAPQRNTDLTNGNYDLALDNNAGLDSSPWSYFQRVYQLPVNTQQTATMNWERFSSQNDWNLVKQAAAVPPSSTSELKGIYSTLEKDFLQQQPEIPLWYNGIWFQGNTKYWKNFPSNGSSGNQYIPAMWRNGYLGAMTTVLGLAQLQPAPRTGS